MPKRLTTGEGPQRIAMRIEECVGARAGDDAFEVAFAVASALSIGRKGTLAARLAKAQRTLHGLDIERPRAPADVLAEVEALLSTNFSPPMIDAIFEELVARKRKSDKGQFFTPRLVVDFIVRALGLEGGERFLDPACGSGAFVAKARELAKGESEGWDIDPLALRVARLGAVLSGQRATFAHRDSLTHRPKLELDVIATNPPFAGRVDDRAFEVSRRVARAERDVLFVERCLDLLRPGGKLAIVLPHSRVALPSWGPFRQWLFDRARVYAVVSLPPETFLPYTAQRTAILFAKSRTTKRHPRERIFLGVSRRVGKKRDGSPLVRKHDGAPDHDLEPLLEELRTFFERERFS